MKRIMTLIFSIFIIGVTIVCAYLFIPRTTVKPKEVILKLDVKEDTVYINKDIEYNPLDNLNYDIENKDRILCTPSELADGENKVTCLLSDKKVEFNVIVSSTYQNTAVFFGDDITKGSNYSWTSYLKENYDFKDVVNLAESGYSFVSDDKKLVNEIKNNSGKDYDFIILQGGLLDVLNKAEIGAIKIDNKDEKTVVGSLNVYLDEVISNFKGKRIGFIINYDTSYYKEKKKTYKREDINKYYSAMKQILDARNIPYLDLFNEEFSNKLDVSTTTYLPDHLYLNEEGYKLIAPDIYEFMKNLPKYE